MDVGIEGSAIELLAGFCLAAAGFGCLYLLTAAGVVLWRSRGRAMPGADVVPVTVLKPLHGDEPGLYERLASFCRQDYSGPIQIVCGVQDVADPAIVVVQRLQDAYPDVAIDLKIDTRSHGGNRKISNVVNMVTLARHPVLVLVDSDIEVGPRYLSAVVGELQKPGVGLVTCLYHGSAGANIWTKLSRLAIDAQFLPNAVIAIGLKLARPCFGSTIALRLETLDRIGGFQAFADCLADDHAIGEAVRAEGLEIAIPPFSVGHACRAQNLAEVMQDDLRCARTIKTIDPVGHLGTIITHPLPLALIGGALGEPNALLLAAIAIVCRIALCRCVERVFDLERHPYWLIPVRDLFSFGVYVASFFGSAVSWRGYRYRVLSDGRMIQEANSVQP